MGHALHFLERLPRVGDTFLKQALGLYYSTERARAVINIALGASLPESAEEADERVALALDDSAAPPYLIASRAGRMVTCLAAGMSPYGARVIDQPSIAKACAFYDDMRGRQATLSLQEGPDLFVPISRDGWSMTRSTFRGLSFLWPWLQTEFVLESYKASAALNRLGASLARDVRHGIARGARTSAGPSALPPRLTSSATKQLSRSLRHYWDGAWLCAHTVLLAFCDSPETFFEAAQAEGKLPLEHQNTIGWPLIRENFWALSVRGLWVVGQCGPFILDALCSGALKHRTIQGAIKNIYGLAVVGLRHPDLKREILPVLERATICQDDDPLERVCQQLAQSALAVLRATPEALGVYRDSAASLGQGLFAKYNPGRAKPSDDVALTFASLLPLDLASAHRKSSGLSSLHVLLPWLAQAPASALYLPDDVAPCLPTDPTPYAAQILINHALETYPPAQPKRAPKAQANRNDLCPCGSGKKFKRCCLLK